jgi:Anti-anti-sigma regulatory factor (antagonist of anti-sigma factor)
MSCPDFGPTVRRACWLVIGEAQLDDVLKLPETMDVARARSLFDELFRRRGTPLTIDASQVEKASALAVEVMVAGARQWRSDDVSFTIAPISDAMLETCGGLGLDPETFMPAHAPTAQEGDAP